MDGIVLFNSKNDLPHSSSEYNMLEAVHSIVYPDTYLDKYGHRYFVPIFSSPEKLMDRGVFSGNTNVVFCNINCIIYNMIRNYKHSLVRKLWCQIDLEKMRDLDYSDMELTSALQHMKANELIELRSACDGMIYLRIKTEKIVNCHLDNRGFFRGLTTTSPIREICSGKGPEELYRHIIKKTLNFCITNKVFHVMDVV